MRKILLLAFAFLIAGNLSAQYETVNWELEKTWFDNGQALPANSPWILHGDAKPQTTKITVEVFKRKVADKSVYFESEWVRTDAATSFSMPFSQQLNDNSHYGFRFQYYRDLSADEQSDLENEIVGHCMDYIKNSSYFGRRKVQLSPNPMRLKYGMDAILKRFLQNYDIDGLSFPSTIRNAIGSLDGLDLNQAKHLNSRENNDQLEALRYEFYETKVKEVERIIRSELHSLLPRKMYVMENSFTVQQYPTEKLSGSLAVDVGYGGIYGGGDLSKLTYSSGAFAGISLPLLSNKNHDFSISTGLFLSKQDFNDGKAPATGPLIGLPIYAGLSYKFLKIVRVSGGMVALEQGASTGTSSSIFFRPYLGIGIGLNVSAARH